MKTETKAEPNESPVAGFRWYRVVVPSYPERAYHVLVVDGRIAAVPGNFPVYVGDEWRKAAAQFREWSWPFEEDRLPP